MTDILHSNNLNDDQNNEIMFENIQPKTIEPDSNFRMELKNKIMNEFKAGTTPSKIPSLRVNFAFAGFAVLVLAVVSIVGQDLLFNRNNSSGLSASEKQNILSKIANSNPLGLLQRTNNTYAMNANTETQLTAGLNETAPVVSKDMAYYSVPPDMYNQSVYTYSRQEFTFGPKIGECSQYNYIPGIGDTISESYYYSSAWKENEPSKYYSKYISKTKDGQILDYSLSDGSVSYEYHGGTYAVKTVYPLVEEQPLLRIPSTEEELKMLVPGNVPSDIVPISEIPTQEPSPTPMPIDEQIASMFGNPDSIAVEKVTENGIEYYVITYSDPYICAGGSLLSSSRGLTMEYSQPTTNPVKVLTKAWVTPDTFSIVKQASYVTMISPENLITQTKYINDTQSIAFEKVANLFNFDLNVEVKEIIIPKSPAYGTDEYYAKIGEFVAQNPVVILTPTSTEVDLSWINVAFESDPWNYSYYNDRNYYASGSYGDAQYGIYTQNQTTTTYIPAIYSITANSYSSVPVSSENQGGYKSVTWSLDIYPKNKTINEIKESAWGTDVDNYLVLERTTTFSIAGQSITAQIYDIPAVSGGGGTPVAIEGGESVSSDGQKMVAPDMYITPEPATNKVVMFVVDGLVYVINIYAQPVVEIQSLLIFNEYNLEAEAGKTAFINLIKEIQVNPVVSEIAPASPEVTEILPR